MIHLGLVWVILYCGAVYFMPHTSYWFGGAMYNVLQCMGSDVQCTVDPHPTPITQSITARVNDEHSYDDSEKNGEGVYDDKDHDEELSLKQLNAAFRPFHCSFRSDSKFIVP